MSRRVYKPVDTERFYHIIIIFEICYILDEQTMTPVNRLSVQGISGSAFHEQRKKNRIVIKRALRSKWGERINHTNYLKGSFVSKVLYQPSLRFGDYRTVLFFRLCFIVNYISVSCCVLKLSFLPSLVPPPKR